jgi:hypothetical protein
VVGRRVEQPGERAGGHTVLAGLALVRGRGEFIYAGAGGATVAVGYLVAVRVEPGTVLTAVVTAVVGASARLPKVASTTPPA